MNSNPNPYETSSSSSTSSPSPAHDAHAAAAAKLYPEPKPRPVDEPPNAAIRALRESDPARTVYRDDDQLGTVVKELAEAVNPMAPASVERVASLASVMTDVGMGRDDVSQLAAWARSYQASPPTAEEEAANARAAVKDLRERYGDEFADALSAARQLAQRDQRFAAFLEVSRLGNHPSVIRKMAELGLAARRRGELK